MFNKKRKRCVYDALCIQHFPSKQDIVTLLCGDINTVIDQDGTTWFCAYCPVHTACDNASVNLRASRLAKLPHLPCHNHTHALDIGKCCSNRLIPVDLEDKLLTNLSFHYCCSFFAAQLNKSKSKISEHAEHVRSIMLAVKGSTVESGLPRLTTDLKPKAVKTCKWTEKASTTSRFVRLFDDLTELTEHEDSKVDFNTSK